MPRPIKGGFASQEKYQTEVIMKVLYLSYPTKDLGIQIFTLIAVSRESLCMDFH